MCCEGSGTLYVAATPIGNAGDASARLRELVERVEVVACEDTRVFGKLCRLLGVKAPRLVSYHEHNEREKADYFLGVLEGGGDVLLASNAGTPLLSDPGYVLVRRAVERGFRVSPLPGPNAAVAALSCSGLRVDRFAFLGFPPRKEGRLARFLEEAGKFDGTVIMYESPRRLARLVKKAAEVLGARRAVVARELTKIHEEFIRGTLPELAEALSARNLKGECCLLVENRPD